MTHFSSLLVTSFSYTQVILSDMSTKMSMIIKSLLLVLLFSGFHSFSQTTSTTAGNWNTAGNWSAGVPTSSLNATVNHAMTIDANITADPGYYTINQPLTDITGGTAYTLTLGGSGPGNKGNFDLYANALFEGALNVNGNGVLTIRSGYTLTVGPTVFANNSIVVIETGATLIINGDLTNNNNSTGITINGALIVNGNVAAGNGSAITGSGTLTSTGTITTDAPSGSIFGSTGDCTTGPCSGGNLCVTNTIAAAQSICSGATPAGLTGNALTGYTYKWQSSITSAIAGFTDISPAVTTKDYAPGVLTVATWFRRVVNKVSPACTATSVAIKISMTTSTWTGTTNTAWATTTNWSCGSIPTSTTDVIIPSGVTNKPVISTSISVKNLTINASAKLITTSAGTLNLYGNFTNNGTYYDAGTTAFVGSTAQVKSGVADSLNNMTVNNAAGVTISSATYVKKYLTLTAGTLASGGNLTCDLYFGAILGAGSGSISGNITVVRTLWKDNWHHISSPLSGRTVADWNDDVLIKFLANSNLYTYDETVANANRDIGWTKVTATSDAITMMKGYALYFTKWINQTQIDLTGTYNHAATHSIALTNTASGTVASDGWNLVGNPYPSEIDWNAASGWTKTGLDNAIYFWDQSNSRYASFVGGIGTNGGTRYIPCMQGFYVHVTSPGAGTLAMTNSVRSSVVNRDNWRTASQDKIIHLKTSDGTNNDEAYVRFNDQASEDFDSQWDAYKLTNSGTMPSISTKSASNNYSINSLPDTLHHKIIPITLAANVSGNYTIDASLSGFDYMDSVVLEDRTLNVFQDLNAIPSYTASLTKGDTTSRFYLHYKKQAKQAVVTNNQDATTIQGINIYAFQQNVTIVFGDKSPSTVNVSVYDAIGNKVYNMDNVDASAGKIEFGLNQENTGIYIVKVESNTVNKTQKVFLSE